MIDFILIGAQKAGTTAAAHNLDKHSALSVFSGVTEYGQHEIEFFNQHWDRGKSWYVNQLKDLQGLRGEKTAELLHRKVTHSRIFNLFPKVKLIVILRNPVERSYSQWKMAVFNKKDETRSFREVVGTEIELLKSQNYVEQFYDCKYSLNSCWREGYIIKGFYFDQLKNLYNYFSRDRVYVAVAERIRKNKSEEYNKMFSFLGLPPIDTTFDEKFVSSTALDMNEETRKCLCSVYEEQNKSLFELLGYKIEEWQ